MGLDTLNLAKEALGLSLALEETHSELHANGIRPTGFYSIDGPLNTQQHQDITSWIKSEAKAGPLILDRGARWTSLALNSVDAQHQEARDFEVTEVCRFFNVLPIMIGHTGDKSSTYASAEAMFTAHRVHTLDPEYTRIQESADVNLLTQRDRANGFYWKFMANGLLRASARDLGEYFARALGSGGHNPWHTQDEIRALLDYDPMGGNAATLLAPMAATAQPSDDDDEPEDENED